MADTVALSGYMRGPTVTPGSNGDIFEFELTHPTDPSKKLKFKWTDIWWIDAYPEPYADQPGGRDPHDLGHRTIWVRSDSDLIQGYITGEIVESAYLPPGDHLDAWDGPQMNFAVGPQGTTFPPCLCPK